ncbi:MAG: hypothetical protein WA902_18945 [Thermosynechococcaceae cyanobacterium]
MKKPDPANFVLQIFYAIIGLFFLLILGGVTFAVVRYFSPDAQEQLKDLSPKQSDVPADGRQSVKLRDIFTKKSQSSQCQLHSCDDG